MFCSVWKRKKFLAAILALSMQCGTAFAMPFGGSIATGSLLSGLNPDGTVSNGAILATGSHSIIDWESFDILTGETLTVNTGGGALLNRINGGSISQLLGTLHQTGSNPMILVNPEGFRIGGQSSINVQNLIMSTLSITNDEFSKLCAGDKARFVTKSSLSQGTISIEEGAKLSASELLQLYGGKIDIDDNVSFSLGDSEAALVAAPDITMSSTRGMLAFDGADADVNTVTVGKSTSSLQSSSFAGNGADLVLGGGRVKLTGVNSNSIDKTAYTAYFKGHTYKLMENAFFLGYGDLKRASQLEGGHLATITSPEEDAFLYHFMRSLGKSQVYFGLTDEAREGDWRWVNGEPVAYTHWRGDTLYDRLFANTRDYAMYGGDGTWVKDACDYAGLLPFFCEIDSLSGPPSNINASIIASANYDGMMDTVIATENNHALLDGVLLNARDTNIIGGAVTILGGNVLGQTKVNAVSSSAMNEHGNMQHYADVSNNISIGNDVVLGDEGTLALRGGSITFETGSGLPLDGRVTTEILPTLSVSDEPHGDEPFADNPAEPSGGSTEIAPSLPISDGSHGDEPSADNPAEPSGGSTEIVPSLPVSDGSHGNEPSADNPAEPSGGSTEIAPPLPVSDVSHGVAPSVDNPSAPSGGSAEIVSSVPSGGTSNPQKPELPANDNALIRIDEINRPEGSSSSQIAKYENDMNNVVNQAVLITEGERASYELIKKFGDVTNTYTRKRFVLDMLNDAIRKANGEGSFARDRVIDARAGMELPSSFETGNMTLGKIERHQLENGMTHVSFDVQNDSHTTGIIEIYDKDGKLTGAEWIGYQNLLPTSVKNAFPKSADMSFSMDLPDGARIRITNNPNESRMLMMHDTVVLGSKTLLGPAIDSEQLDASIVAFALAAEQAKAIANDPNLSVAEKNVQINELFVETVNNENNKYQTKVMEAFVNRIIDCFNPVKMVKNFFDDVFFKKIDKYVPSEALEASNLMVTWSDIAKSSVPLSIIVRGNE